MLVPVRKDVALCDFPDQRPEREAVVLCLVDNRADRDRVGGPEFPGEGKSQQVRREGLGKTPVLLHDQFLELDGPVKIMLSQLASAKPNRAGMT